MASEASIPNMAEMVPAMQMHDLTKATTTVITDAQGRPVTHTELEAAQNPGYLTRIKQAATRHPWLAKAMIGVGTIGALTAPVAATDFDFSFIGNLTHSLITSLVPVGADVTAFLNAWIQPIVEIVVVFAIVGLISIVVEKGHNWAKKL